MSAVLGTVWPPHPHRVRKPPKKDEPPTGYTTVVLSDRGGFLIGVGRYRWRELTVSGQLFRVYVYRYMRRVVTAANIDSSNAGWGLKIGVTPEDYVALQLLGVPMWEYQERTPKSTPLDPSDSVV